MRGISGRKNIHGKTEGDSQTKEEGKDSYDELQRENKNRQIGRDIDR